MKESGNNHMGTKGRVWRIASQGTVAHPVQCVSMSGGGHIMESHGADVKESILVRDRGGEGERRVLSIWRGGAEY